MDFKLKDKVAIVTGAAQGLGHAISLALAREDARVVAADLQQEKAENLLSEIRQLGADGLAVKTDVSNQSDVDELVGTCVEAFGSVDILVNSAGICPRTDFQSITGDEWDKVLQVNLKSAFMLCQKVLPIMAGRKYGKIVNIASAAGKVGGIQVGAHYSASKAGMICLTKSVALNGAPHGVNVNAICPGVIDTEITTSLPPERIERYKEMIPLGRIGMAEDVANLVLFLVSDISNYITGETTDINGGLVMD